MPGLPFTRDHPHLRSPAGVMSCDEIRYWVRFLLDHGWRTLCLARTLGFRDATPHSSLKSKLRRSWIYPAEQVRMSTALDRIISGELVQVQCGNKFEAMIADNPRPLELPMRLAYDFSTGRLRYVRPRTTVEPLLPSFSDVLSTATYWTPPVDPTPQEA